METKPYSLQSPEQIAKDYGGNKQKIAEAMQMGVIDPTAGTLAGMFIDRMRSAAQAEAAPQQTVAQKVFAPPQMPAGLGATPEAAQMPMPPVNPTASAPSPADMGALGGAPQVPGMADGGLVRNDMFSAPYMNDGGLASLPVPDGMFDEPSNGGYASGGLVAFAMGGLNSEDDTQPDDEEIVVTAPEPRELAPPAQGYNTLYGMPTNMQDMINMFTNLAPPKTKEESDYEAELAQRTSPEEQKADRKAAFWEGIGKLAGRLGASQSPTLLGGLAESLGGGATDIAASLKAQKDDLREMQKERAALAGMSRKEKLELIKAGVDLTGDMARLSEGIENRKIETSLRQEELGLKRQQVNAMIAEASKKGIDIDAMLFTMFLKGGTDKEVANEFLKARYGKRDGASETDAEKEARIRALGGKSAEGKFEVLGVEE